MCGIEHETALSPPHPLAVPASAICPPPSGAAVPASAAAAPPSGAAVPASATCPPPSGAAVPASAAAPLPSGAAVGRFSLCDVDVVTIGERAPPAQSVPPGSPVTPGSWFECVTWQQVMEIRAPESRMNSSPQTALVINLHTGSITYFCAFSEGRSVVAAGALTSCNSSIEECSALALQSSLLLSNWQLTALFGPPRALTLPWGTSRICYTRPPRLSLPPGHRRLWPLALLLVADCSGIVRSKQAAGPATIVLHDERQGAVQRRHRPCSETKPFTIRYSTTGSVPGRRPASAPNPPWCENTLHPGENGLRAGSPLRCMSVKAQSSGGTGSAAVRVKHHGSKVRINCRHSVHRVAWSSSGGGKDS